MAEKVARTGPRRVAAQATLAVAAFVMVVAGPVPAVAAPAQGRPAPVIDRADVLTERQERVLIAAVRDVRERTDYLPTIVAVPALSGRSARQIATNQAPPPAQSERVPLVLVLVADPPRAEVVVQTADLSSKESATIEDAKRGTLAALVSEGLGPSGLAFTGALIEGGTRSPGVETALSLITVVFVIGLAYFALRVLFRWRRTRAVPKQASTIGAVEGGEALVHGRIVSGEWVSIGGSPQMVWYERTDTSITQRYRITRWTDGTQTSEHAGTDTHKEITRGGCEFVISDGTGQAWAHGQVVDGYGTKMDSSGWFSGSHSHWTEGIPLGAEVTLGGPCHRSADGTLVFEPRGGAGVLLAIMSPGASRRAYRRPMYFYLVKAAGWTLLYSIVSGLVANA